MALQETQSSTSGLDFLYCHEEILVDMRIPESKCQKEEEEDHIESIVSSPCLSSLSPSSSSSSSSYEDDDDCNEIVCLISKEENEQLIIDQTPLIVFESFRKESIEWMMMVNSHLGFSISTLVLAVNYFDRFVFANGRVSSFWITQLVSVACLSLASKVQETHVPLLLDFQINCKYVFQPKTVMKMELLVMSTLEWKMNPVTPFSYFEHLTRRLRWKQEILMRSDDLLLSLISEPGYLCYPPSVLATAVVLHSMGEVELWSRTESETLLMDAFKMSKEKIKECCKFISEVSSNSQSCKRRKICSSHSV